MAINQPSMNNYRINLTVGIEPMGKLRQMIRGRSIEARPIGGRTIRKKMVVMTVAKFLNEQIENMVKDIVPDAETIRWMNEQRGRLFILRQKADEKVRQGINRKPKSQWLKPGRVKGKDYGDSYPKKGEKQKRRK